MPQDDSPQDHPGWFQLLAALQEGYVMGLACRIAGVPAVKVHQWLRRADQGDPVCAEAACELTLAEVEQIGVSTRYMMQLAGNEKAPHTARVAAAKFVLERRGGWIQEQRSKVDATVEATTHAKVEFENPVDQQFDAEAVRELADHELDAALTAIANARSDDGTD